MSVYLIIKGKSHFLGLRPLSPNALKESVIKLGASFVKLAQVLATRADFFPTEYLDQLKELHDKLPPMNQDSFDTVYSRAFGTKSPFERIEQKPIASASIGQVHAAFLPDGTKVAVKLRRLGIKEQVKADITIIETLNTIFRPLFSKYTKNSIEAVLKEFSKMILQEVSFVNELQNLVNFSNIYKDSAIRFPKPYPSLCSDDALVMSFEEGFRFDDKESLQKYDIDFKPLIKKLVNFYTQQMLIEGYFHADPHPGNLLVTKNAELVLLDFGMVKRVPSATRVAIIELIKAANEQNYELYIIANKKLGTIAYEAPTGELAEFTAKMFAIFSDKNLDSQSMQELAFGVLESTKNLPFKLPSDAIYILRVSAIIEGLGTTYIENFNGIKDILPVLEENLPKALGAKDGPIETIIDVIKDAPFVLQDFKIAMQKVSQGGLETEISKEQLDWIMAHNKESMKSYALSFSMILGGIFVVLLNPQWSTLAIVLFILGVARVVYK